MIRLDILSFSWYASRMKQFRTPVIILISLALLATASITVFALNSHTEAPNTVQTTKQAPQPPTAAEMLSLVNQERAKNGVAPLVEDARLDQSAQRKADDMFTNNYFAHVSPVDGKHGYEYINDTGIYCKTDSENLVWNLDKSQITSQQAMGWWISSTPHHTAMIDKTFTLTGFGIVKDVVVEHFCSQ